MKTKIIDYPCPTCGKPSAGFENDEGVVALDCWDCFYRELTENTQAERTTNDETTNS